MQRAHLFFKQDHIQLHLALHEVIRIDNGVWQLRIMRELGVELQVAWTSVPWLTSGRVSVANSDSDRV